jgi:hypothetical protein
MIEFVMVCHAPCSCLPHRPLKARFYVYARVREGSLPFTEGESGAWVWTRQAVRKSKEMLAGLGDAWVKRQEHAVQQCARDFLVTSWGVAIDALRPSPPPPTPSGASDDAFGSTEPTPPPMKDKERAEVKEAFAGKNARVVLRDMQRGVFLQNQTPEQQCEPPYESGS